MPRPLAYLLTWTTYGTWLPGDERGWVTAGQYGIRPADPHRKADAQGKMESSALTLTADQRTIVEDTIRAHCRLRGWELHAVNARSNHVHVVVTAEPHPDEVMRQLKAWCSRRLSEHAEPSAKATPSKDGRQRWWTEHGSTKWINDPEYLENAIRYVLEGQ